MHTTGVPRGRQLLGLIGIFVGVLLALGLVLNRPERAFAGDPSDPAAAVETDLTAQGYEVIEVGGPDTDPDVTDATVIMEMVSDELDEVTTAQLQAGWVALDTYYSNVDYLLVGLQYEQRYILVYAITKEEWQGWLRGDFASEDFWDHVLFGVYDTTTGQYVDDQRDFLDKNFNDSDLPGPDPITDPSQVADPSSLVFDVSSLLIPANSNAGVTALARVVDDESNRLPGQTVTFTVTTKRAGVFSEDTVLTNDDGVARATYLPPENARIPASGLPVELAVSGPGDINATQKLLVLEVGDSNDDSIQAVSDAMENAGYDLLDFYFQSEQRVTGEFDVYGGPMMDTVSAAIDAAFFQQTKAGFGTTLTAFPRMTSVYVFQRLTIRRTQYWVVSNTVRSNWDAWANGQISEGEFWGAVFINTYDKNFQSVDSKSFLDKDFGTGQDNPVQTSSSEKTYSSSLVLEDWGPQYYYGEFSVPNTATMDNFSAELLDGAQGWQLYEVSNLNDPIFDSQTDDINGLTIGAGTYFMTVVADEPPASVEIKATLHVRY